MSMYKLVKYASIRKIQKTEVLEMKMLADLVK